MMSDRSNRRYAMLEIVNASIKAMMSVEKACNLESIFVHGEICTDCDLYGCECCNKGIIHYVFNSEPKSDHSVIGINERMVND